MKIVTKMHLFKGVVLLMLLYGSETWVPFVSHSKRLQAFIMWCLHVILVVMRWDNKRNTELRSMADIEKMEVMLMRRRLHWLGHLVHLDGTRLPKCLLVYCPQGGSTQLGARS